MAASKSKTTELGAKARETGKQLGHVSHLRVPRESSLPEDLRKYMRVCREKLGLVPNVIKAFSLRPAKLRTFIAAYGELMLSPDSALTKLEREMIAVTVSSHNQCVYCIVAHGQAVRELSGDPVLGDILSANYRDATLSARHRAMLDYAWKLTATSWLVGEADRAALRKAGFDDEGIFDVTDVAAYFNYTNRMATGVGMAPNDEYFAMNRLPPPALPR
ncbi:MAG: alkylhydroperoxidase [Alphaproteobacteria bacterium]|nr:alkylhydroperoxidase [Alphaproteobacteria bacterium]